MKQLSLFAVLLAVVIPSHAINFTKKDLVGDWKCTTTTFLPEENITEIATTLDRMKANGDMSQLWEVAQYDQRGNLWGLEYFVIKNRWDLKGKHLHIFDWQLDDYKAFDGRKIEFDPDAQAQFKADWQEAYRLPYQERIEFVNKRTYRSVETSKNTQSSCKKMS